MKIIIPFLLIALSVSAFSSEKHAGDCSLPTDEAIFNLVKEAGFMIDKNLADFKISNEKLKLCSYSYYFWNKKNHRSYYRLFLSNQRKIIQIDRVGKKLNTCTDTNNVSFWV